MKFADFKSSLNKKVESIYLIEGEDAYFRSRAVSLIKNIVPDSLIDLNINYFLENYKAQDIIESCICMPFMSDYRVVIVYEYYPKASDYDKNLKKYFDDPNPQTILVFVNSKKSELSDKQLVLIDCNKEDQHVLNKWVNVMFKNEGVNVDNAAVNLLIEYCLHDMARINTEIKKLCAYAQGSTVDIMTVELLVKKDTDFQIYELTDAISKKDATLALNILESLLEKNDVSYINLVLMSLYSAYKRMFLIKTTNLSDLELSNLFKIKEYAVKMLRRQTVNFDKDYLEASVKLIAKTESDFKTGNMNVNLAIRFIVYNLTLRREA